MNATSKPAGAASAGFPFLAIAPQVLPHGAGHQPSQCALTLQALLQHPHTSDQLHALGIYEPRSRVAELRKRGCAITTVLVPITDRDGYQRKGVALYTLESMPCQQAH